MYPIESFALREQSRLRLCSFFSFSFLTAAFFFVFSRQREIFQNFEGGKWKGNLTKKGYSGGCVLRDSRSLMGYDVCILVIFWVKTEVKSNTLTPLYFAIFLTKWSDRFDLLFNFWQGRSLVVHLNEDKGATGGSGSRVACASIIWADDDAWTPK